MKDNKRNFGSNSGYRNGARDVTSYALLSYDHVSVLYPAIYIVMSKSQTDFSSDVDLGSLQTEMSQLLNPEI